ncbi:MAG: hypothetical protein ACREJC_05135 [Tepidisphaeraceae bacterium]
MNDTKLMPLTALARRLNVPSDWLRDEARAGRLPHLRAGKQILFEARTVERLLIERARAQEVVHGVR